MNTNELSDVQSESGIIATLIEHPDFLLYSEHLKPNHFYDVTNGCLYWAIQELYKSGIENIDSYNLTNVINSNKSVKRQVNDEIQDLNQIIELGKNISRNTVEEYNKLVSLVSGYAYRRDLFKELQSSQSLCFEDKFSLKDLQKNVFDNIDKINNDFILVDDVVPFGQKAKSLWNETKIRQTETGIAGIPSKFPEIHNYFSYEPTELVLVSALRKEGKSIFCMNEAIDKIEQDIGIVYFDTEMNDKLFNERLVCNLSGIKMKDLKSGNYTYDDEKRIAKKLDWIESKSNFFHIYLPMWTKEELYITSKKLKRNNGIQMFIMDYFKSRESKDMAGAYLELGNAVNFVKNEVCGDLELAGLSAAQLNRGGEIADSFKIEQYASVIVNLKRKKEDTILNDGKSCGNYKLFVKLNRLGDQMDDIDTDYIDLQFEGNYCRFTQAKEQHKNENPFK